MNITTIVIFLVTFVVMVAVLSLVFKDKSRSYKKRALKKIAREGEEAQYDDEDTFVEETRDKFAESVANAPILGKIALQLAQSGLTVKLLPYLLMLIFTIVIVAFPIATAFRGNFGIGFICSIFLVSTLSSTFLAYTAKKKNALFLDNFPDAIDIIVRSVKSGHPILASLRMIAESDMPGVSPEFQKIVDEVSYGRPLQQALRKMAERVDLLDVNFFVVILGVQQETGGNLSEVLSNLSGIIRKRKQLRMKINALTSEGRLTAWIFAFIPVVQGGAVFLISPGYLDPLFVSEIGNIILAVACGMIVFAVYMSRKMCNVDM